MSVKDYMLKIDYKNGSRVTVERDALGLIRFSISKDNWFQITEEEAKELVAFLSELIAEKEEV